MASAMQYEEPYILHDACGVHGKAEALMEGLKVREEELVFHKDGRFTFTKRSGREGQSSSEMHTDVSLKGTFVLKGKDVALKFENGAPKDIVENYRAMELKGGAIVSNKNSILAFV